MVHDQVFKGTLLGIQAELELFFLPGIKLAYFKCLMHENAVCKEGLKQSRDSPVSKEDAAVI